MSMLVRFAIGDRKQPRRRPNVLPQRSAAAPSSMSTSAVSRKRASSSAAARAAERLVASCFTSRASGSKSPPVRDAGRVPSRAQIPQPLRHVPHGPHTVKRTASSVMPTMTSVCTITPRMARRHKAAVRVSIYAASCTMASAPVTVPPLRSASVVDMHGRTRRGPQLFAGPTASQRLRDRGRRGSQQRDQPRRRRQRPAGGIVRGHSGYRFAIFE